MELVRGGRSPSPRPLCAEAAAAGTGDLILPTVPLGKAGGGTHRGPDAEAVVHGTGGVWQPRAILHFADLDFQCGGTHGPPRRTPQEPAGCYWQFLAVWPRFPWGWHQGGFGSRALSAPLRPSRFRNPTEAAAFSPRRPGATLLSLCQRGAGVLMSPLGAVIGLGSWRQPLPCPAPGFGLGGQPRSGPVPWVTGACGYDAGCPRFRAGVVHVAPAPSPSGVMVRPFFPSSSSLRQQQCAGVLWERVSSAGAEARSVSEATSVRGPRSCSYRPQGQNPFDLEFDQSNHLEPVFNFECPSRPGEQCTAVSWDVPSHPRLGTSSPRLTPKALGRAG